MASRLEKRLLNRVARACVDFDMLEDGDRVLVALSGGKDSFSLLALLERIRRRVPFELSLVAVNLDEGHPGYPQGEIGGWLVEHGYEHRLLQEDTYALVRRVVPEGDSYCSLCARVRRGILYNAAVELGCTKVALGHHREDLIETLLLNLFYAGQLKSMAPRLRTDDGRNVVIRPLVYCDEDQLTAYAADQRFPVVPRGLCGADVDQQRARMKALIATLDADNPKVKGNMMAALARIRPTHLLDRDLLAKLGPPADPG